MKIGINGLGRIGRHLFRMLCEEKDFELIFINEPNLAIEQLRLLLQHDSIYGSFLKDICIEQDYFIMPDKRRIKVLAKNNIMDLQVKGIDLLIESSGKISVSDLRNLISKTKNELKIVVTCNPKEPVDQKIVFGFNEEKLNIKSNIISSLTCDATAILPILKSLSPLKIDQVSIVSLHPYLSGQQLLDNSPKTCSPNADLSLLRSAFDNLIPKNTSAAKVCMEVFPELKNRIISYQLRVPTSCVTAAFVDIDFENDVDDKKILHLLEKYDKIIHINKDELVSKDFAGSKYSTIVDVRRLKTSGNKLKLLIWYDNEVGYSARVVDLIKEINRENAAAKY